MFVVLCEVKHTMQKVHMIWKLVNGDDVQNNTKESYTNMRTPPKPQSGDQKNRSVLITSERHPNFTSVDLSVEIYFAQCQTSLKKTCG